MGAGEAASSCTLRSLHEDHSKAFVIVSLLISELKRSTASGLNRCPFGKLRMAAAL